MSIFTIEHSDISSSTLPPVWPVYSSSAIV
jgi:hypothetical protein